MDQTDIKILALLQKDATCSVAEIAEQVNLSVTPCWRRIQKLKDDGVSARNAILLDPRALGLNLTVFVSTDLDTVERRILDRWLGHGFDVATAQRRAVDNDLPNARRAIAGSVTADLTVST